MDSIISNLYKLIQQSDDTIDLEERIRLFMYDVVATQLGEIFTKINNVIKVKKQQAGWTVEHNDTRQVLFTFGWVTFTHTLMHDPEGNAHYPFDEWMGLKKHKKLSRKGRNSIR